MASCRSEIWPATILLTIVLAGCVLTRSAQADDGGPQNGVAQSQTDSDGQPAYRTELVRGKVVWLAEALESEFGISTVAEVAKNSLALLTPRGDLLPIVENLRGRAFRKDPRLREMEVEILARRHEQQPFLQVLRLYQIDGEKRYEVDYWCDVCAIVMYETGPCSCCQDDNRHRKRLVEELDLPLDAIDSPSP